jgi:hypothetical protein
MQAIAFSSEVDIGAHKENASNQIIKSRFCLSEAESSRGGRSNCQGSKVLHLDPSDIFPHGSSGHSSRDFCKTLNAHEANSIDFIGLLCLGARRNPAV